MKSLFLLVLLFLISCCDKDPVSKSETNISQFEVVNLFEHEGCKVYRFYDNGRYRYFTNCSATFGDNSESCGRRQCPKNETITTSHNP